jgi:hypothetical protein
LLSRLVTKGFKSWEVYRLRDRGDKCSKQLAVTMVIQVWDIRVICVMGVREYKAYSGYK